MKIQYTWEIEDIKAGQRFGGKGDEVWMIGYYGGRSGDTYVPVSLIDGVVGQTYTKSQFVEMLNSEGYKPLTVKGKEQYE